MKKAYNILPYIIVIVLGIILFNKCSEEPEIITETVITTVHDTITNTIIEEKPTIKYVTIKKTIKGKDSIIYVDKPNDSTIQANEYETTLESNKATAKLDILTTGELLDVKGIITYPEKETTTTVIKNKSGLFLYGETSVQPVFERVELGLDYQIKNKIIIGISGSYNNIAKKGYVNAKIGFNLF